MYNTQVTVTSSTIDMLSCELLETIGQSTIIILFGLLLVTQVSVQSTTCSCDNMLRSEFLQRASIILVGMVQVTQLDVYLGVVLRHCDISMLRSKLFIGMDNAMQTTGEKVFRDRCIHKCKMTCTRCELHIDCKSQLVYQGALKHH